MEPQILQVLETIRAYVFIIMCAIVIWMFFKILESSQRIIMGFKDAWEADFKNRMNKLLNSGQYEKIIKESKEKLEKHPNHSVATWFIEIAYFYTENNELAKSYFEKAIYLSPSWEESAKVYQEKLNER